MVVQLPRGAQLVGGLQVGGRRRAGQDQLQQPQPHGMGERPDGLAQLGPARRQHVSGRPPVLPGVLPARWQRHDPGEHDSAVRTTEPGLQPVQNPEFLAGLRLGRGIRLGLCMTFQPVETPLHGLQTASQASRVTVIHVDDST